MSSMVPCSWPHDSSNLSRYSNCLVERPRLQRVTLQYTDFPNRNPLTENSSNTSIPTANPSTRILYGAQVNPWPIPPPSPTYDAYDTFFFSSYQAQSICFKIQCDQYLQTAAKDATGERAAGLQSMASTLTGQGITVSNIVDYMSLIEQRSVQASVVARDTRSWQQHDVVVC